MKNLKKIYDFIVIFVFVLAAIGGTQNPATIRPMLTMRQIQNGMVFFAPFIA